ncbi:MAG: N-acetyltransferase [Acidobacteria bacterium]|nr:N-acetyltransferase [Acidobacteriota bacterium]
MDFQPAQSTLIRPEQPDDAASVRRVNELAFNQHDEANLVEALHKVAVGLISLVAVIDGQIVGHILFSPATIQGAGGDFHVIGLAPMAVLPEYQNRGIGSQLVRAGLAECHRQGHRMVIVLGHPNFYPRFGFVPARPKGITCEYDVSDDTFMVAELEPGALAGCTGLAKYHPAFAMVG